MSLFRTASCRGTIFFPDIPQNWSFAATVARGGAGQQRKSGHVSQPTIKETELPRMNASAKFAPSFLTQI